MCRAEPFGTPAAPGSVQCWKEQRSVFHHRNQSNLNKQILCPLMMFGNGWRENDGGGSRGDCNPSPGETSNPVSRSVHTHDYLVTFSQSKRSAITLLQTEASCSHQSPILPYVWGAWIHVQTEQTWHDFATVYWYFAVRRKWQCEDKQYVVIKWSLKRPDSKWHVLISSLCLL